MIGRNLVVQSCRRQWANAAAKSGSLVIAPRRLLPTAGAALTLDRSPHRNTTTIRSFHATSKQEILPVLAVGTVLLIGRYSWKALNRMDEEWEDYQWALQQYERQRRKDQAAADAPLTIGVDLGTIYLKLSSMMASDKADLVPTAQGDRYRFTGILMDQTMEGEETMVVGRPALEKFFYPTLPSSPASKVVLPYRELQKASHDEAVKIVQQIVLPTVGEAMERAATTLEQQQNNPKRRVRTVLTVPPVFFNQHKEKIFRQNYHDESHHTLTVPDPVAAIWGAQSVNLLPTPASKKESSKTTTLVVDVGGLATSVSLVRNERVIGTSCLDNVGGESYVQQLSERILQETMTGDDASSNIGKDVISLALIHSSARSSAVELVQKTSAKVHIPFLFMGRKADDPHFDLTISRTVMDQTVQDYWTKSVIPKLMENGELSSSLPPPTSAAALITSAITKVLEESGEVPMNIQHILLVGGGSKFKLFEQAFQDGISALMGPAGLEKMVIPHPALRAELTSMGAAALLPNYDYDYDRGLERVKDV